MIIKLIVELPTHRKLDKMNVLIRDYAVHTAGMIIDWDLYKGDLWKTIHEHFNSSF